MKYALLDHIRGNDPIDLRVAFEIAEPRDAEPLIHVLFAELQRGDLVTVRDTETVHEIFRVRHSHNGLERLRTRTIVKVARRLSARIDPVVAAQVRAQKIETVASGKCPMCSAPIVQKPELDAAFECARIGIGCSWQVVI